MIPSIWTSVSTHWYALEGVNNSKTRDSHQLEKGEIVEKLRRYFSLRACPREQ